MKRGPIFYYQLTVLFSASFGGRIHGNKASSPSSTDTVKFEQLIPLTESKYCDSVRKIVKRLRKTKEYFIYIEVVWISD